MFSPASSKQPAQVGAAWSGNHSVHPGKAAQSTKLDRSAAPDSSQRPNDSSETHWSPVPVGKTKELAKDGRGGGSNTGGVEVPTSRK